MNIQQTSNYSVFKTVTGNRKVNENHVMRLVKSIADKNFLPENPIIVNENMEVIDGQHRLAAAQKLGVAVPYTVIRGGNLKDIQKLNTVTSRWGTQDFLDCYVMLRKKPYQDFKKFLEENEINVEMALNFLGQQGGANYKPFKNGDFTFTPESMELAEACATFYNKVKNYFVSGYGRKAYIARAILKIIIAGVEDDIIKKLESHPMELQHGTSVRDYLRQFENVLNFKTSGTTRLF